MISATPWEIAEGKVSIGGEVYVAIQDAGPECPCFVAYVPDNCTHGVSHQADNARLIAEAPNLRAALHALVGTCLQHRWKLNKDEPDTIDAAMKACIRTEGGAL